MQILRNRTLTAQTLQRLTEEKYNIRLSEDTIKQRLREYQLTPKIPARGPLLIRDHRRSRLAFTQNHVKSSLERYSEKKIIKIIGS
ncbi:HTH Tnp Tc3 2 domain containing protein [Asbolus verrucosus]|uniref:HTH Tnp Tc3 2 domain containing protein n=1 Tax=Asbolus verrucosus TaxID=1661398 RepID=A0A482WB13_ASBVE|nr:HTH Tnp Tc3 2 domain containing protein [Asbolus verrucosus]